METKKPRKPRRTDGEWMSCGRARAALSVGVVAFKQLAAGGHIGVRAIPGLPPKYSRADVEALAKSSIHPKAVGDPQQETTS